MEIRDTEIYIEPISKVVFAKTEKGTIPIGINYEDETGNFETIEHMDYFQIFIEYVIRSRQYFDPIRKKFKYRELYPYQWAMCLKVIDSVINGKGRKIMPIFSRQWGKSESIKVYLPFLVVFARQYVEFPHERFTGILGSYKQDTIEKLRKEVLPYFKTAIKVYNELYPEINLVSNLELEHSKLVNNSNRLELSVLIDGEYLPYSECFFITLGTPQDSLTSHLTVIDESGKCDNDLFDNSISPFSNSTGGTQVFIGIPSTKPNSLLQKKYEVKDDPLAKIDTYFYNWTMCYTLAKKVNPEHAEITRQSTLSNIATTGGHHSATNRMNYYLEFMKANGMFLSKDVIRKHDMMSVSSTEFYEEDGFETYRVAGIDISATATGDYFVISRGTSWQDSYGMYRSKTRRITTLNKNKEKDLFTPDYKANKICDILEEEQIDMCMIDSTSQQLHFVQTLRQKMSERGLKTMLVPLSYSNQTKQILFSNWEDGLYSGFAKLPNINMCWESEMLYNELQTLIKKETTSGVTYEAYKNKNDIQSRQNTDDHCNSVAMLHYCLQYLDVCVSKGEWFKDGTNFTWRAKKFKVKDMFEEKPIKVVSELEKMRRYLDLIP